GSYMFLRRLQIKNYQSLEDVTLDGLGHFNVLIGRNNTGKSAVFNALSFLARAIQGQSLERMAGEEVAVLTNRDTGRSLEINLEFEARQVDREEFISLLTAVATPERRQQLLASPFFRHAAFTFKSPAGAPHMLHLRGTRLRAEDNQWATTQSMKHHDDE